MVVQIDPGTLMLARVFLGLALAVALTLGICEIMASLRGGAEENARD